MNNKSLTHSIFTLQYRKMHKNITFTIICFLTRWYICIFILIIYPGLLPAQNNYEIQVYASQTQAKGSTMFELHSNYTFDGSTEIVNGVIPSNHSLHETVEITTGITPV